MPIMPTQIMTEISQRAPKIPSSPKCPLNCLHPCFRRRRGHHRKRPHHILTDGRRRLEVWTACPPRKIHLTYVSSSDLHADQQPLGLSNVLSHRTSKFDHNGISHSHSKNSRRALFLLLLEHNPPLPAPDRPGRLEQLSLLHFFTERREREEEAKRCMK